MLLLDIRTLRQRYYMIYNTPIFLTYQDQRKTSLCFNKLIYSFIYHSINVFPHQSKGRHVKNYSLPNRCSMSEKREKAGFYAIWNSNINIA